MILPSELWIKILTHPSLISSHAIQPTNASHPRKRQYAACARVCKAWRRLLSDPYTQALWALSFTDQSLHSAILFAIQRKWSDALQVLTSPTFFSHDRSCAEIVLPSHRTLKRQAMLNDALVYAVSYFFPVPERVPSIRYPKTLTTRFSRLRFLRPPSALTTTMSDDEGDEQEAGYRQIMSLIDLYRDDSIQSFSAVTPAINGSTRTSPTEPTADLLPLKIIQVLLSNGADVQVLDNFALRRAARAGSLDLLLVLLRNGAAIDSRDHDAIHTAAAQGHLDIVIMLLEHGGDALRALKSAHASKKHSIILWLFAHGNLKMRDAYDALSVVQ